MSRLQNSNPETVSELMDRIRIPEMLTSLRMALVEFVRCRKGLWYTVIDYTEWTEELFDSLIAGADLGDAIIYFYKPYNNNDEHTQFGQSFGYIKPNFLIPCKPRILALKSSFIATLSFSSGSLATSRFSAQ